MTIFLYIRSDDVLVWQSGTEDGQGERGWRLYGGVVQAGCTALGED